MTKHVGILTAGGDCPGLNAAIRAIGKGAMNTDMRVISFRDGFRGLMENRTVQLEGESMVGLLDHAWIESARSVGACLGDLPAK